MTSESIDPIRLNAEAAEPIAKDRISCGAIVGSSVTSAPPTDVGQPVGAALGLIEGLNPSISLTLRLGCPEGSDVGRVIGLPEGSPLG